MPMAFSSSRLRAVPCPTRPVRARINLWGGGITVPQYADVDQTLSLGAVTISVPIVVQANQTWSNSDGTPLTISGSTIIVAIAC